MRYIFKSIGIYSVSAFVNSAIPFLLIPLLTFYLSTEDFGKLSLFQTTLGLLTMVVGLNLHSGVAINYFKLDRNEYWKFIVNVLFLLLVNLLVAGAIYALLRNAVYRFVPFSMPEVVLLFVLSLFQVVINIVMAILQMHQKVLLYNALMIGGTLINVGVSILLVILLGFRWEGRVIGMAVSVAIVSAYSMYYLGNGIRGSGAKWNIHGVLSKNHIKDALFLCIPLVIFSISGFAMCNADRYIITALVNVSDLGVYSVSYSIGMIISLLGTSVNRGWFPYLCESLAAEDRSVKKKIVTLTYAYCLLALLAGLVFALLCPILFRLFINVKYHGSLAYINWIIFAYVFEGISTIMSGFYLYAKNTLLLSTITAIFALFNIGTTYMLVKIRGPAGAAQASFVTYLFYCIVIWIFSSRVCILPWKEIFSDLIFLRYKNT